MKSIREMSGKLHEFVISLDKAGVTPELMQLIISSKDNQAAIAMAKAAANTVGYKLPDPRFSERCMKYELVIPDDYNHKHQLEYFRQSDGKKFEMQKEITDEKFLSTNAVFFPKERYLAEIWKAVNVSAEECRIFLEEQGLILAGARGLTLIQGVKGVPIVKTFKEEDRFRPESGPERLYAPEKNELFEVPYMSYFYKQDERHGADCSREYFNFRLEETKGYLEAEHCYLLGFRKII